MIDIDDDDYDTNNNDNNNNDNMDNDNNDNDNNANNDNNNNNSSIKLIITIGRRPPGRAGPRASQRGQPIIIDIVDTIVNMCINMMMIIII